MGQILIAAGETISAAGPVDGSQQSTAAIDKPNYTASIIASATAGSTVRVGIEDSPDGTNFTPFAVWIISGTGDPATTTAESARGYNAPGLQRGANAQAQLNIYSIEPPGATANITASIYWPD